MFVISINDNGLGSKLAGANFGQTFSPAMKKSVDLVENHMKVYPAPPGGSRYRRTFKLRRGWKQNITSGGSSLLGRISNNVSYGPYVQAEGFQANVHQGRWQTDEKVLNDNAPSILSFFDEAAEGFFK